MTTMKNRRALALSTGVWVAALGSATAFVYDLNPPLNAFDKVGNATSPFASALLAGGWFALMSIVFWWLRKVPIAQSPLIYARAPRRP